MGGRRKGLVLLWTQLCIFLVMSMALGALCMLRTAITREEACERAAGRIYLAQEVMEKIKYKEKTQRFMAVPEGAVERGGRDILRNGAGKPGRNPGDSSALCPGVS